MGGDQPAVRSEDGRAEARAFPAAGGVVYPGGQLKGIFPDPDDGDPAFMLHADGQQPSRRVPCPGAGPFPGEAEGGKRL